MNRVAGFVVAPVLIGPVGGAMNMVARLTIGIALPTFAAAAALCAVGTIGFGLPLTLLDEDLNVSLACAGAIGVVTALCVGYSLAVALYTGGLIIFTIAVMDCALR